MKRHNSEVSMTRKQSLSAEMAGRDRNEESKIVVDGAPTIDWTFVTMSERKTALFPSQMAALAILPSA